MPTYRPLTKINDLNRVVELEIRIWDMGDGLSAVPSNMLHAVVDNGGVLIGAEEAGELIGFVFGFPARQGAEWYIWSHMAGVLPEYQRQNIGYELKQQQRHWALAHGYRHIAWTFDPLRRGNAHFNITRLGAVASEYKVNVYGMMRDGLNAGLQSDRLVAVWHLDREPSPAPSHALPFLLAYDGAAFVLDDPLPQTVAVEIPHDLAALKRETLALAQQWQTHLRETLQSAFAAGYVLTGFVQREGRCWYVLEPPTSTQV